MSEYDNIYERGIARESAIWPAFAFNGPFSDIHDVERNMVFGLYAGTYLHGLNYLREIQEEDLLRVVAIYDSNMAQLAGEEAQVVLEVSAKRYLERINDVIHDSKMGVKSEEIAAINAEYDAKLDALSADEAALATKRYEITIKQEQILSRIVELEAAIAIEGVDRQMIDLDITRKQLEKAKVDLAIVEAGLRGLDIQLAITQAGIEMANTDISIANAENSESELDLRISNVAIEGLELDNRQAEIALESQKITGYERNDIKLQTKQIAARTVEIETAEAEVAVKESELNVAIKKIEADGQKLDLVNSDLTIIAAQEAVKKAENELLRLKSGMIEAEIDSLEAETKLVEGQTVGQVSLDAKKVELIESAGNAYLEGIDGNMTLREYLDTLEIGRFTSKRAIADALGNAEIAEANQGVIVPRATASAASDRASAAAAAAGIIANANITNKLTHAIG